MQRCVEHAVRTVLTLALTSSSAMARPPTVIWCNACTDQQKQAAAVESNAGSLVYVADVVARNALAFDADSAQGIQKNWRIAGVPAPMDMTPAQAEAIRTLTDFYEAVPQGWRKSGLLHYTGAAIDAQRVARDGAERRTLVDWVSHQPDVVPIDLLQRVARALQAVRIHQQNAAPSIKYRVDFPDGSRIDMTFALSASTPGYVIDGATWQDSRTGS